MRGLTTIGILVLGLALLPAPSALAWDSDARTTVTRVIDGDTFDSSLIGRVRLADIDTPEVGGGRNLSLPLWMPYRLDTDEWVLVFPGGHVLQLEEESSTLRR